MVWGPGAVLGFRSGIPESERDWDSYGTNVTISWPFEVNKKRCFAQFELYKTLKKTWSKYGDVTQKNLQQVPLVCLMHDFCGLIFIAGNNQKSDPFPYHQCIVEALHGCLMYANKLAINECKGICFVCWFKMLEMSCLVFVASRLPKFHMISISYLAFNVFSLETKFR